MLCTKQCLTVLCRFVWYALYAVMTDVPAIADFCKGQYIIVFAGVHDEVCVVPVGEYEEVCIICLYI